MAPEDNNHDPGEPVAELRELTLEPKQGFADRVMSRVNRREASNQLLGFFWQMPVAVFLAFVDVVFALFGFDHSDRGGKR